MKNFDKLYENVLSQLNEGNEGIKHEKVFIRYKLTSEDAEGPHDDPYYAFVYYDARRDWQISFTPNPSVPRRGMTRSWKLQDFLYGNDKQTEDSITINHAAKWKLNGVNRLRNMLKDEMPKDSL